MAAFSFETTSERSDLMRKIKSVNTKPEVILRKALWNLGVRYRLNDSKLIGKPDIVIRKHKTTIFVDSEFFHGKDWCLKKLKIKANRDYWIPKIERNIARDLEVNEYLKNTGWTVLRFWSNEIKKNLPEVIATIEQHLRPQQPVQLYPHERTDLNIAAEPSADSKS